MASTTFIPRTTLITADWLNDIDQNVYGVKSFGAVGDDSIDDTAAIQSAINALPSTGGVVYFPAGLYRVNGQLSVTKDQVYFVGDGSRRSAIRVAHDLGVALTVQHASAPGSTYLNAFGMLNMSMRARVETTNGSLLKLNKVQLVTLDNVFLEDHFGGLQILGGIQHYYTNLHILSTRSSSPVNWTGSKTGSYFLNINKSSDGQTPSELFIDNFNFRRNDAVNYIENGIVVNSVDGLWLSNGHIMGVASSDMRVEPVNGDEQITGIKISNVWFDNNSQYGLRVVGTTTSSFGEVELNACRFLSNTDSAIFVEATPTSFEGIRMVGGAIRKSGNYGVLIRAGKRHLFNGVDFGACNTNGSANQGAVTVDGGADKVSVIGCVFDETALGVTATAMIGVRVNANASSKVLVNGCQFNLTASDISDSSTADDNAYPNNITDNVATATSISGSSLVIPEIGDVFYVSNGLNFDNMTGRWNGREVTLVFAGVSTVTHGAGGIRLSSSTNFVSAAGNTLTLVYEGTTLNDWIETGRMVA